MGNPTRSTKRKQLCAIATALLLCPAGISFAAGIQPDAGTILNGTRNAKQSVPERQNPSIAVDETIRPPMIDNIGLKVRVDSIVITGQDVFAQSELDVLFQDLVHKELTFFELNHAAAIVTKHFKDHGYLLAQAYLPAQEIAGGKVEIAILVGRYGDIVLKNKSTAADSVLKMQLAGLKPGAYINTGDLERAVLLAGDLARVSAKITLSPGSNTGTADVIVETQEEKTSTHGSLILNNWGNRFTGRTQGTINYQFDNLAHMGDSVSASITDAGSGLDVGSASFRMVLAEGLNLNLGYSKVQYALGKDYAALDAHGTAHTKHADLTWNVTRSRNANFNLLAGYDYKRLEDLTDAAYAVTRKRSRSTSLGLTGDSFDKLWGGGANSVSLIWHKGSLSAESNAIMPPTGSWQKTNYSILRQQALTQRLSLMLSASGQQASTNLDSSEKFSLGGANGVRAYPADEASGDEGWLVNSELHWTIPVKNKQGLLQLVGFYDHGVSHLEKNPDNGEGNRRELAAKGLGLSWTVPDNYAVKLNYAWKAGHAKATSDTDETGRLWLLGIKYF